MWLDKDNNEDPYNRGNVSGKSVSQPNVGAGAGGGAPVGAGEGNQTNPTPSNTTPSTPTAPQQKVATVQDYLGANKAQGNQLGQTFQTNLNNVGQKDTNAIDTAASNVTKQAKDATVAYDPNLVSKAYNDPTSVANDPNQLQSFLGQWNASYTGPQNFEGTDDYTAANKAATDAQTKATEVSDAGGRKQLLQDDYGVYGDGNKGLDQTLLQNSDNFGQVLDTGKQLASLPDYLTSKAADVNAATTKAANDTAATKTNTQGMFQNSQTDFQNQLSNEVNAAKAPATDAATKFQQDFASGDPAKVIADIKQVNPNIDDATLQSYLTAMNTQSGKPTDLGQFYNFNPNVAITKDNAASADDYARAAALQKLTGVDYTGILNPANASQAGTAPNATTGINPSNVIDYLKNKYDTAVLGSGSYIPGQTAKTGVPGIPDTPATGPAIKSQLGIPGLDQVSIPSNATPQTIQTLNSVFNSGLNGAGTYHEGALYDITARVQQLQGLVKNGQISQDDYNKYVQPILGMVNSYGSGATGTALSVYNKAKQYFHNTTGL